MQGESAALKECEDGMLTTCSGRLFHKQQADIKKDFWKKQYEQRGYKKNKGDEFENCNEQVEKKYEEGEMIDSFLMIHLQSRTFCLERRERRLGQFSVEVSSVEEADQRFVHSFAANLWTDS